MPLGGGCRCPPAWLLLLCQGLLAAGGRAAGHQGCQEQAVAAPGALRLLPKEPREPWQELAWKLNLDKERQQRILEVRNGTATSFPSPFAGRVTFQWPEPSLQLSPTSAADSGLYLVEFGHPSGAVTTFCFQVVVWEPLPQPLLETHIVHREQGCCNLSLLCSLPAAGSISYSWSCPGAALAGNQSWLHLEVQEGAEAVLCHCNASNPVSWVVASTDVSAACQAAASGRWWMLAVPLALLLAISIALGAFCCRRRKPQKDLPEGHDEQMLTVYEEVGKARASQALNGSSQSPAAGSTIYALVSTKAQQDPNRPQDPQSSTIYATVQATRKSPSLRRKRLNPALVSTAYTEVLGMGTLRSLPGSCFALSRLPSSSPPPPAPRPGPRRGLGIRWIPRR
ncbi:natural killer cell receptor 2B4 [Dryobates pubescens]|uniref:natural killer cell receptor 2B4 n=1 Tax=Dryobates pubescens TaxID=118200 RepID=UPI0023B8BD21|nr:natural killer cell receptor 2B4 [Dryobates pubescens]